MAETAAHLVDHVLPLLPVRQWFLSPPKPDPDGRTQLIFSPPDLIERIAALVPPPRMHRHRYYGVLAPNAPHLVLHDAQRGLDSALGTEGYLRIGDWISYPFLNAGKPKPAPTENAD